MSKLNRGRRKCGFETLDQRIALSVNPIGSPGADAAGEGETASVDRQGSVVTVIGSDNDDVIELDLSTAMYKLTINGDELEYSSSEVDQFLIQGDAGNDQLSVVGTNDSNNVEIDGGELRLESAQGTNVRASLIQQIVVTAGAGADRVLINDTAGDDQLELRAESAKFVDSNGLEFTLNGFDRVRSFANAGGTDTAIFYDTASADRFVGKEAFSFMVGDDFWNYARGYDDVQVRFENGGQDSAWLFGTAGDDQLVGLADELTFTLDGGGSFQIDGFAESKVMAGAGTDSANLEGVQNGIDLLTWDASNVTLTTTRGSSVVSTTTRDFEQTEVIGGDAEDTAELFGSEDDDSLIALPEVVQLTTPTSTIMVHRFGFVVAQGGAGNDNAHLEDSAFNDNYVSKPDFAYLSGPGYTNLVKGFDVIDVAATNGGYDRTDSRFATTVYIVDGGLAGLPQDSQGEQLGRLELSTAPGNRIIAFTQYDLEMGRVQYVYEGTEALTDTIGLKVTDSLGLESTGEFVLAIPAGESGQIFNLTLAGVTGPITQVNDALATNYFVLDQDQYWVYGTSRNERVYGFSRARATGPGNIVRNDLEYYFLTRGSQDGLIAITPPEFNTELDARDASAVPNYDLVDGVIVQMGDAFLNPPQIDF